MAEEALEQGTPPAEGAEQAGPPPASPEAYPEGDKTPEQLAAEKAEEEKKQKEADDAEEQAIKKKPWFQKRIDEITRQRHEAERRAQELQEMLQKVIDQGRQQAQPGQQQTPPQQAQPAPEFQPTRPAPTREQYEFDEEKYLNAVVDWRLEQREAKAIHERRQAEIQTTQRNFLQTAEQRRIQTIEGGRAKYPDYDESIKALPYSVMNEEMLVAVLETDNPVDVSYHLAKNPAEAERISKLPFIKKAMELGRLETKISQVSKPTSQAPPPPTPVGGRTPARKTESAMTMEEWLEARRAGKITGHS